jgi:hypothetical protein
MGLHVIAPALESDRPPDCAVCGIGENDGGRGLKRRLGFEFPQA